MLFESSMVKNVIKAVFPTINKKEVNIIPSETFTPMCNYWDDGYRCEYGIVELATLNGIVLPSSRNNQETKIKPGYVVVKLTYSGQRKYLTIYCHPSNMPVNLEGPKEELSQDELAVLYYTASYKSSYAGRSNYRHYEYQSNGGKMTETDWDNMKLSLMTKGFLLKNGALSINGKNRAANLNLDWGTKLIKERT